MKFLNDTIEWARKRSRKLDRLGNTEDNDDKRYQYWDRSDVLLHVVRTLEHEKKRTVV